MEILLEVKYVSCIKGELKGNECAIKVITGIILWSTLRMMEREWKNTGKKIYIKRKINYTIYSIQS